MYSDLFNTILLGSDFLMERTGTDKRKKEMVVMPGLKHDIFHEKQPDGETTLTK